MSPDARAIAESKPGLHPAPVAVEATADASQPLPEPITLAEALRRMPLTPRQRRRITWLQPYARLELPRFGKLLNDWGMNDQAFWQDAPPVTVRQKGTGFDLRLELSDFYQRINAFLGDYHEFDVVDTVRAALRPGDLYLDGGANIGLITLHASHIVGPTGTVLACEPFTPAADRLQWHIDRNNITNIDLRRLALSDQPGRSEVKQVAYDSLASSTLGPIPDRFDKGVHAKDRSVHACPVETGDRLLATLESSAQPLFVKLDIEGFELRAIHGLHDAMCHRRCAFLTEVNQEVLEGQGHSPLDIFDHMVEYGYMPFGLERHGAKGRFRLLLNPLTRPDVLHVKDVLWLTPTGPHWVRLRAQMRAPGLRRWG
ncbi:MAG: FkbM family methyltransferase [Planctomycetota bacterium]